MRQVPLNRVEKPWAVAVTGSPALAEARNSSGVPLFRGGRSGKNSRRQPLVRLARRCRVGTMPLNGIGRSHHLRPPFSGLASVEPSRLSTVCAGSTYYRQVLLQGHTLPCRSSPRRALTPPNGALHDNKRPRPLRGVSARSERQFVRAERLSWLRRRPQHTLPPG